MSRTILVCQHESCPRLGAAAVLKAFKSQAPGYELILVPEKPTYLYSQPKFRPPKRKAPGSLAVFRPQVPFL